MMMNPHSKSAKAAGGFALMEVVIAMFVLAIGILGAGALQTVGMQTTQGAYYRTQAMFLASDILNRMRANRSAAASYVGDTSTVGDQTCLDNGCSPAAMATADMGQWALLVNDSKLPGVLGSVSSPSTNRYIIRITWNENEWQSTGPRASSQKKYELNVALDNN